METDQFAERMAGVRQRFAGKLLRRLNEIDAAVAHLADDGSDIGSNVFDWLVPVDGPQVTMEAYEAGMTSDAFVPVDFEPLAPRLRWPPFATQFAPARHGGSDQHDLAGQPDNSHDTDQSFGVVLARQRQAR